MLDLIVGLIPYGIKPFVVLPEEGEIVDVLKKEGISYIIIPFKAWMQFRWKSSTPIKQWYRNIEHLIVGVRRLLANIRCTIRVAKIVKSHDIKCIYTNTAITPVGLFTAKLSCIPHIWHLQENAKDQYSLHPDLGKSVTAYVISRSNKVIALSKSIAQEFFGSSLPKNLQVVHNGMFSQKDISYEAYKRKEQKDTFTLAIVGLLHRNKGQDQAIRALASLSNTYKNVRLLIAGNGDEKPLIDLASSTKMLDNIEFLGFVNNTKEIYQRADVVLMCSTNEGLGRVTLEAMAANRPVVGNASGGTLEIIKHGYNGLLYDGSDLDLVNCITKVREDNTLAESLANNAYDFISNHYTIERYANKIYLQLKEACNMPSN